MGKKAAENEKVAGKGLEGKYLTFDIGSEVYGISILKVKEIIGIGNLEIHAVPNIPEYAKGVINLRDKVIPIISLRLRFGMEEIEYSARTCVVVVEIERGKGHLQMGVVVDSVSEVLNVSAHEIEAPPQFGTSLDTAFILGMAKVKGDVNILLDIDNVLTREEVEILGDAA
ncbi:MAG: chemotaxis protein CheW [Proteobacteria bacterium]|nr:chemotaxis protein CheW [Pseudomonadota bacterium]MBU1737988.1 chemotaxis protein CheW [Pseudomonadota bacterium]